MADVISPTHREHNHDLLVHIICLMTIGLETGNFLRENKFYDTLKKFKAIFPRLFIHVPFIFYTMVNFLIILYKFKNLD